MAALKEIVLQLFFALMPFLLFNVLYRDKPQNYSRKFVLISGMASLFLSMTFSASAVSGYLYDTRNVILFFGLLFGGLEQGFILFLLMVLYRLYLGGDGTGGALLTMVILFPVSLLLCKLYRRSVRKLPVILAAGLLFSVITLLVVYLFTPRILDMNPMFHLVVIPVQNIIGCWLLISLFQKAAMDKELFIAYGQKEKTETISQVAASLVHEVRNPLTAVKGFLKLIRESGLERDKVQRYIDICESEMERAERILSEYLAVSKPPNDRQEPVGPIDLSLQLRISLEVMRPYANMNNVGLEGQMPDEPVSILANPERIKQVFINLIKNAIEACSGVPGGHVTLELRVEQDKAVLTIEDNGIGMTKEQAGRLGSAFYSTKTGGTGLGLAFCYQTLQAMGGTIALKSAYREGTRFTIHLPLYRERD
ncbi:HAMP domain-containing sensor histidine kinase [Paenibacillus sp. M1]|uniref:histidine kinase n=1 Tax=Paenibacillus haidiansis TaxID=1574488 RepID=A0ABU7VVB1_9BACL